MFRSRQRPAPIDIGRLATAVHTRRSTPGNEMSLDEVAEATGIHKSTLSLIENGKTVVGLETFVTLCDWLGMPMDHFRLPKEDK